MARTMAPTGMVDTLGWFSSPEVGIISLVVFLVLSISLVVLCMRCNRQTGNAYDVSGTTTSGANGNVASKAAGSVDTTVSWRSHQDMPPSTLSRNQ